MSNRQLSRGPSLQRLLHSGAARTPHTASRGGTTLSPARRTKERHTHTGKTHPLRQQFLVGSAGPQVYNYGPTNMRAYDISR